LAATCPPAAQHRVGRHSPGLGCGGPSRHSTKSADQGWAAAQVSLGLAHAHGTGVPKDPLQAQAWLGKAAAQGDAEARFQLGQLYATGKALPQDLAESLRWTRQAADQGHPGAQHRVGQVHEQGLGVPRHGQHLYEKAADQGLPPPKAPRLTPDAHRSQVHPRPHHALKGTGWPPPRAMPGQTTWPGPPEGWGVPVDHAQALPWFQKAAEQGHADALFNLGSMHDAGRPCPKTRQSGEWYRAAAVQSHTLAQLTLADRYDRGRGVAQSDAKAHLWFNVAAASGNARAAKYRDYAAKRMNFEQLSQAQKQATACQQSGFKGCD
jgi:hypothetical protein